MPDSNGEGKGLGREWKREEAAEGKWRELSGGCYVTDFDPNLDLRAESKS